LVLVTLGQLHNKCRIVRFYYPIVTWSCWTLTVA
jgi:hypothetical protein